MSTVSTARAARRLAGEHPAWSLLRSQDAAASVALLGRHLARSTRRLSEATLVTRLDDDIAALRRQGFDVPGARSQIDTWLRDGVLVRRPGVGVDGTPGPEQLELSDGGLAAVAFVARLARPHRTATPTRLSIVLGALRDLARDVETDPELRLAALRAERDRIDAEIDRVRHGTGVTAADPAETAERVREVLALAADIPADLLRVRAALTESDAELRRELTASGPARDAFVDDVFRGVDHLAETPSGSGLARFRAVLDAGEHDAVDQVTRLLRAPGAAELTSTEAGALRRLLPELRGATDDATDTMTTLRRALQRAARSGGLPREQALAGLLRDVEATALELADDIPPTTTTRVTLRLGAVAPLSPGGVALHDPADVRPAPLVRPRPAAAGRGTDLATLRTLARAAEIDDDELRGNVNEVVTRRGSATIGDVLAAHPATQGLASVVGLLSLAGRHGLREEGRTEDVVWPAPDGTLRHARLPRHRFEEPVP